MIVILKYRILVPKYLSLILRYLILVPKYRIVILKYLILIQDENDKGPLDLCVLV